MKDIDQLTQGLIFLFTNRILFQNQHRAYLDMTHGKINIFSTKHLILH